MTTEAALLRALIDALLVFEGSGPEEINPDTAVRGMENVASSLLALDDSAQQALRKQFVAVAEESEDESYGALVRSLPDMLGLASG